MGAPTRATTSVGTPVGCDQIAATPGPAWIRSWLPSSPAGGGGATSPSAAAACAAFSAENVNVALMTPAAW